MNSIPFCIIDKPYTVWSHDSKGDNLHFLERVDADLYYRTAHNILGGDFGKAAEAADESGDEESASQARKDVSSLSRLLWHHGMETLVMMLGAYVQAPWAVHAYFLKCKTDEAEKIAQFLIEEKLPTYHRLQGNNFNLKALLDAIHRYTVWEGKEISIERMERALRDMLHDYAHKAHRAEYNSIKHGFRASHGAFAMSVGLEEVPGVAAPAEAMEMVGYSRDASFFDVARPLTNASKEASKIHFQTEKVTVSWSLEKVLSELQLMSVLLNNVVGTLRIVSGTPPTSVSFTRIPPEDAFWDHYFELYAGNIPNASFHLQIDAASISLPDKEAVFDSYRKASPKPGNDEDANK